MRTSASTRGTCIALAAILLGGLLLRLALFPGTQISDDVAYIRTAHRIAHGTYDIRAVQDIKEFRLGLLLPMAVLLRAFGTGEFTGALFSMLSWTGVPLLLFFWTRRLLGPRPAILACLFSALVPLDVLMSSTMFPEVPVAVINLAALLALDVGLERRKPALWFLAGLLVGLGYFVKESSVFWIPSMILWCWWRRGGWRPVAALVGAVAVVFAAEFALYALWAGDPMHRHRITQASYVPEWAPLYSSKERYLRRLFLDIPDLLFNPAREASTVFGCVFLAAIPAGVWAWRQDRARMAGPLWLLLGLYLTFNFFPGRLVPYMPNGIMYRYLYPFLLPAYMILAWACDRALRRKWLWAAVGVFLAYQAWMNYVVHVDADNRAIGARLAARQALAAGATRIHTDPGTAQVVALFSGYRIEALVWSADTRPGDWVIANGQMEEFRRVHYGEVPRPFEPAAGWKLEGEHRPRPRFRLRTLTFLQPPGTARVYHVVGGSP
jgi:hypothetical protein